MRGAPRSSHHAKAFNSEIIGNTCDIFGRTRHGTIRKPVRTGVTGPVVADEANPEPVEDNAARARTITTTRCTVKQEHRLSLWVTQAFHRQPTPIRTADKLRHASLLCLPGSREAPLCGRVTRRFLKSLFLTYFNSISAQIQEQLPRDRLSWLSGRDWPALVRSYQAHRRLPVAILVRKAKLSSCHRVNLRPRSLRCRKQSATTWPSKPAPRSADRPGFRTGPSLAMRWTLTRAIKFTRTGVSVRLDKDHGYRAGCKQGIGS